METSISEIKKNIDGHRKSVKSLNFSMWVIVILALVTYIMITSITEGEINRLASLINDTQKNILENKISKPPENPTKLVVTGRESYMGYIVLTMIASVLLAIFGRMRFNLKELSLNEQLLISITLLQSANNSEIDADVKKCIISNSFLINTKNEPSLNFSAEIVSKISDAVVSKVESLVKSKNS